MHINMEKIKTYLTEYPQKFAYGDIHGLVDVLFWDYLENNGMSSEAIREATKEAEARMSKLTEREIDEVFDVLLRLCVEFQRASFTAGMQVGTRLTLELTEV